MLDRAIETSPPETFQATRMKFVSAALAVLWQLLRAIIYSPILIRDTGLQFPSAAKCNPSCLTGVACSAILVLRFATLGHDGVRV